MHEAGWHTVEGQVRRLIPDCSACSSRPYRLARTSHLAFASGTPFDADWDYASIVVNEGSRSRDPGVDLCSCHKSQP